MKNQAKQIPNFKTEDEEREFWSTHSPLDYMDVASTRHAVFPDLKPTLKSISIRLPEDKIEELKVVANKRDVPYQSLAKMSPRPRNPHGTPRTQSRLAPLVHFAIGVGEQFRQSGNGEIFYCFPMPFAEQTGIMKRYSR
jgi:predicted DNA binding CopG/RHH family protein